MGVIKIKFHNAGAVALLVVVILVVFTGISYADRNVPAMPEIQGLSTSTGMNVQGTITETDAGAWSVNANGIPISGNDPLLAQYPYWSSSTFGSYQRWLANWNSNDQVQWPGMHVQDFINAVLQNPSIYTQEQIDFAESLQNWVQNQGSSLNPPLNDQEVQYTTGYNDQLVAVSGQSTLSKTITVSTVNRIVDQSNIKADTSLQYVAIDTGRATRTEDLLLDGAAQASNTSAAILCPFANSVSSVIPAYCNIEQAGSSMDTTLTSVVTHADDRFVGTDSAIPVILNYNINAQGITLGSGTSSPMIGSVSAFLKVHVQEARNINTSLGAPVSNGVPVVITQNPQKSEDLVYSETSTASGLITHFGKSMSYQSGFNLV